MLKYITKIGEFHACWHAVVTGQVHGTSVSHVDQIEFIHPMLIRMGHITVFEYVFCILGNKSLYDTENITSYTFFFK
jgi:hypothetical protein